MRVRQGQGAMFQQRMRFLRGLCPKVHALLERNALWFSLMAGAGGRQGDWVVTVRSVFTTVGVALGAMGLAIGQAHAQGATAPGAERGAAQPWYDRFTYSAGAGETDAAPLVAVEARAQTALSWAPNQKWGVTVNVRDARQATPLVRDEASIGAFYNFTPRLRVGGAVSMSAEDLNARAPAGARGGRSDRAEPSAGVKLESAFKF